jgi:3-dehydroquinate synthetase
MLGMRYELRLSHLSLGCSMGILHQYERFFETIFPTLKFEARVDDLLPYLNRDKKNNQGYRMSLLKNPGHPQTGVLVSSEAIHKCFQDDLFL